MRRIAGNTCLISILETGGSNFGKTGTQEMKPVAWDRLSS
jgi:hypothetical protein